MVQCNFYKLVLVLTVCIIDFIMDADLIVSCYMHYDRGAFLLQPLTAFTFYWYACIVYTTHTHTHPFNVPFSGTTQVSRYQKGKTNLDFTEARDSEWQWHQLGHMQVCTSLQTDDHASIPPLSFLQAGFPSCRPTNSVKALKAQHNIQYMKIKVNKTYKNASRQNLRRYYTKLRY